MQVCHKEKYKNSILRIVKSNLQPLAHFIDYDFFKLTHTQRERQIQQALWLQAIYKCFTYICLSQRISNESYCQKQIRSSYYLCDTFFIIYAIEKNIAQFLCHVCTHIAYSAAAAVVISSSNLISGICVGKSHIFSRRHRQQRRC